MSRPKGLKYNSTCAECGSDFTHGLRLKCEDGLVRCPRCRKSRSIKQGNSRPGRHVTSRYGITEEQYVEMVNNQNGVCAICGKPCQIGKLSVDHNHDTGIVRGLLCRRCNAGLGAFGDNSVMLQRAIDYLGE